MNPYPTYGTPLTDIRTAWLASLDHDLSLAEARQKFDATYIGEFVDPEHFAIHMAVEKNLFAGLTDDTHRLLAFAAFSRCIRNGLEYSFLEIPNPRVDPDDEAYSFSVAVFHR